MTPRLERRSPIATAIVSLVLVLAAVVVVAVVQRRRTQRAGSGNNARSMANMPGMFAMPGISGTTGTTGRGSGTITVSPSQQRALGISFATVDMRSLAADTRATGVVTFDETRIAQVAPKFNGFAERLYVNATGQPVARGEALLDVYSPDVLAAEQELLLAEQLQRNIGQTAVPGVPANTTDLVVATRRRLELWDISPAQIDDVLRSREVRRTFTLYSPTSGVVVSKNAVQGQAITAGQALYTIADLADVWIDVQLRESDLAAARIGAGADIDITGLPGQVFKGRVAYVYPTLDTTSRAVRARVVVSNSNRVLKPGMYATVHLRNASRSALTVPTSAVLRTGTRNVVFVEMGAGRLMPVEIEVGQSAGDVTEVLSGLEPGQRVVTSAQFLLDSESNLAEVTRSTIRQMPSSSPGSR